MLEILLEITSFYEAATSSVTSLNKIKIKYNRYAEIHDKIL